MQLSKVKQVMGYITVLFCVNSSPFTTLALDISQQLPPAQLPPAQLPPAQCQQQQIAIETSAREWIERSRTLSQTGQPEQAATTLTRTLQLIQQLSNVGVQADLMRSITDNSPTGILQTFVYRATPQQAETVLSVLPLILEIARSLPTAYSSAKTQAMTAVAEHYITFNRLEQAATVLAEAQQAANFLQGAEFQTKALTAIAQGYKAIGNSQQTLTLLDQSFQFAQQVQHPDPIRQAQILQPIAITYAQVGAFDQAIQVAQLIPSKAAALAHYYSEALAVIVREYVAADQVEPALQLANRITLPTTKATTMAWLAASLRAENLQLSQNLLEQAIAIAHTEATHGLQSTALHQVILEYVKVGEISVVLPVVDLISDPRTKAQALVDLAALETDRDQASLLVNQALNVAQQIEDINLRDIIIYSLIDGYLSAEQYTLALQITQSLSAEDSFTDKYSMLWRIAIEAAKSGEFNLALQAIESIPTTWLDYRNQGFRDVAVGYAKAGQYDQAMQLVQQIDNFGSLPYQVRTLAAISEQAARQGDISRANALLEQALSIANILETTHQTSDALTAIAIQYTQLGQLDRAAQLRSQAIETVQSSQDTFDQGYQLRQIVDQYLNAQQYEIAVQTAQMIPDEAERDRTLNEITAKLIEAQQLDDALQATNALSRPEDKTRFLVGVVSQFIASGQLEEASQILRQALQTAQIIPGDESKILQIREDLAVDDPYDRGSFLETIALQYAAIGEYDQALQVVQTMQNQNDRDRLRQQLSCPR